MKKITFIFATTVIVFILMGCITTPMSVDRVGGDIESYCIPEIGTVVTSYIGDKLIQEGTKTTEDVLYLYESYGTRGVTTYHPAGTYSMLGCSNTDTIYQFGEKVPDGWHFFYPQIKKTENGDVYRVAAPKDILIPKTAYEFKNVTSIDSNNFEQTIIYTGKEGNILRFTYREFVDDMARAAFTIDAIYDISDDKILRFKGMSLEVIEVDNQSITYKLLSGFNN